LAQRTFSSYAEAHMTAVISLLRAVNVGGRNQIKMEALRSLYKSLGLENPRTHIQSGNVIFGTKEKNLSALASRIANAIEQNLGVRAEVILRTPAELSDIIARNPFASRTDVLPNKLHVTFLARTPIPEAQENIRKLQKGPEELYLDGRELYIHFPNGAGNSKLQAAAIDRALKTPGTARNWNTILKLLELSQ
jgi:uncharacterized protein (DUF1697 family)